jgi:hypothetical protein
MIDQDRTLGPTVATDVAAGLKNGRKVDRLSCGRKGVSPASTDSLHQCQRDSVGGHACGYVHDLAPGSRTQLGQDEPAHSDPRS